MKVERSERQASDPLCYAFVDGLFVPESRAEPPSYNAAPSQLLYVIRENHETGERTLDLLRWGLIPNSCTDPDGGRQPINARAESVAQLPTFGAAYAKRRCIVPVDCFFEWRAVKGQRAKQPYAVAMKDRTPFGIAGLWENWLILPSAAYDRWLGREPDPNDLLAPFPAEAMAMWPVSTRVNSPENDDASLLEPAA